MRRRAFLLSIALAGIAPGVTAQAVPMVEVWRSPTCGCCGGWVRHLQENGFATRVHMVEDTSPARRSPGMPDRLAACHSARAGGYALEGHVPASDIRRLLREKPKAKGLAVPGMPAASPGMDVPNSPPYDVLLVRNDGRTEVFARHGGTP